MHEIEIIHDHFMDNELLFGKFTIIYLNYNLSGVYCNEIEVEDIKGKNKIYKIDDFIKEYKEYFRVIKLEKIKSRINEESK